MAKKYGFLPAFYQGYVERIAEDEVMPALANTHEKITAFLSGLPETTGGLRYAENKWTVKEVISHMIDAERIFAYRALRFARNDATPLAGFDENVYIPESNASNRRLSQLSAEFNNLRISTIDLYSSFTPEMMSRSGEANGQKISVDALGFVIAGHANHHYNILKERYGL